MDHDNAVTDGVHMYLGRHIPLLSDGFPKISDFRPHKSHAVRSISEATTALCRVPSGTFISDIG